MEEPFVDCEICGTDGWVFVDNQMVICTKCNGKGFYIK